MNIKYPLSCLLLCFCFPLILNAQEGNCVISTTTSNSFHLALDNKFQNKTAAKNIKITGIPEGDYWVTILFQDTEKKAVKTNITIHGDKETSYNLEEYKGVWKLNLKGSVAKSAVQSLNTDQTVLPYNKAGVEVKGISDATEINKDKVHSQEEISRVHGDRTDPNSRRMGTHKGSSSTVSAATNPNSTAPAKPAPKEEPKEEQKEGTFVVSKYIEVADGTKSIVEERVTTIKQIVEHNGQRQMKTKTGTTHTPTDFNCLPMEKAAFIALKESVQKAATDQRLSLAENGVKGQCMTPGQIKAIGDLILSDVDRNTFAIAAQPTCADPKKFPYTITEPVAVKEEPAPKEEPTPKEEIKTEQKTEAEIKAELKAFKQKEKEEISR